MCMLLFPYFKIVSVCPMGSGINMYVNSYTHTLSFYLLYPASISRYIVTRYYF
jgi:hypothetical protein